VEVRSLRSAWALSALALVACSAELLMPGPPLLGEVDDSAAVAGSEGNEPDDDRGSGGGPDPGVVAQVAAGTRYGLVSRLSKFEYKNSIADVLDIELTDAELDDPTDGIPPDTGDGVFKHLADNQTSVEQHALGYFKVAESLVKRLDTAALVGRLGTCTETTEACGEAFIHAVGRRLYRRPLEDREVEGMMRVYRTGLDEELEHEDAVRWTLLALLQAPQFLFRFENELAGTPGQARVLGGYELAARLASFLWVSVPDEALLTAAEEGSLLESSGLETEVERMLADPKAQRLTEVFATDFSRARFASFDGVTDEDKAALNESIIATFQDHFWTEQASVADLFTTTRFIVNPTVAELLGVAVPASGLQAVDVSDLPERVGLMSHPAMIAGMGDRAIGSFVNRGKYLMERLLCRHPIAFPADITTQVEAFNTETAGLNERERAEVRMGRGPCWSCHEQFEPLAFGFARFDAAGRYVGEVDEDGKPLPLDGWVPTGEVTGDPKYVDVQSYMTILATNPVIQTCMTEHFIDFATSRIGDEVGKVVAEKVGEEYLSSGSTLQAMVMSVAHSELFRTILPGSPGAEP
jgi:Protein of unknown function (DUF1592)/Protein of unknown function (DUF1588)/Protein of unknown function (DUF1595)/Protein of unknown function (DUF1587)